MFAPEFYCFRMIFHSAFLDVYMRIQCLLHDTVSTSVNILVFFAIKLHFLSDICRPFFMTTSQNECWSQRLYLQGLPDYLQRQSSLYTVVYFYPNSNSLLSCFLSCELWFPMHSAFIMIPINQIMWNTFNRVFSSKKIFCIILYHNTDFCHYL